LKQRPLDPASAEELLKRIPRNVALRPMTESDPTCFARPRQASAERPAIAPPWDNGPQETALTRPGKVGQTNAAWRDHAPPEPPPGTGAYIPLRPHHPISPVPLACPLCDRLGARLGERCVEHDRFLVPEEEKRHARPGSALGKTLGGKYVLLGRIGSGGMGTVYWAIQRPIGRRVAVKVMRNDLMEQGAEKRFMREAQAISSLLHPHLVTCYDYGVDEDRTAYMVLEYIEGRSLQWLIRNQPPGLVDVLHVTRQILEGLAEVHKAQVIHRDLKPSNIMLCRVGHNDRFVKIIDFGLARILDHQQRLTVAGEVFGTPRYMSPEQAMGDTNIGAPADIYALGIITYELLCGQAPFDGRPMSIIRQQERGAIPPLRARPDIGVLPSALRRFVDKCLQKDPRRRYRDAEEALGSFVEICRDAGLETRSSLPHPYQG
jgi:serine/threonine protein kinase